MVTANEYTRIALKMADDAVSPEEARSNGAALGQLISAKVDDQTRSRNNTLRAVVELAFLALAVSNDPNLRELSNGVLKVLGNAKDNLPAIES